MHRQILRHASPQASVLATTTHVVLSSRIPDASTTRLTVRKASRNSEAQPLPEARTDTFSLLWLILCCRNACSQSTARPHPAGMPEDASTGSDNAPLTRILRRPRCMSMARVRASAGNPASLTDVSSRARSTGS
eukprot:4695821-Amphidinium_carterae.2